MDEDSFGHLRYCMDVASWTFLTNHAHVLLYLARHSEARIRDIADAVGITERAAQRIVSELADAGYLSITREGRRNRYKLNTQLPFRHDLERDHKVSELVDALAAQPEPAGT